MTGWRKEATNSKQKKIQQAKARAARMAQNPVACSRCYAPLLSEDEREAGIHARHEADRG